MIAHHTLVARVFLNTWGNMFDAGYFWHYNELWIGGATAPGEKSWEIACLPVVFCMRMAAASKKPNSRQAASAPTGCQRPKMSAASAMKPRPAVMFCEKLALCAITK